jgi:YHS domain-containing protein
MMNLFARAARFLLWLLFVSWSVWLLRRLVGWLLRDAAGKGHPSAGASSEPESTASARRLVRDPVCGMHVDETLSIPLRLGGELVHFCSPSCRDSYAVTVRKHAANG